MKIYFTLFLLVSSITIYGQQFEIVSAEYSGEIIPVKGEVVVDVAKKSIALNINDKEMSISKMTFKKGDVGELLCFKENIDAKQRFKFTPNKDKTGDLINVSHIMIYTIVQGFSNKRSEFVYHLIKKRKY